MCEQLNCNATLADLNQLLTQISVSLSVAGNYTLTVVANDLGAGSSDHSITQSLTATGFVSIIGTFLLPSLLFPSPLSSY